MTKRQVGLEADEEDDLQKKSRVDARERIGLESYLQDAGCANCGRGVFVMTSAMCAIFERIQLFCDAELPVLLEGPTSSGKSAAIEAFAKIHNARLIVLNLGEQSEPKSLLGTYIASSDKPGQFRWTLGVLARAMQEGAWVVIEDLHLASAEFCAVLRPLLESRRVLTSSGELRAHEKFRIFATSTTANNNATVSTLAKGHLHQKSLFILFMAIKVPQLTLEEGGALLVAKFPKISRSLVDIILSVYKQILTNPAFLLSATLRSLVRLCGRLEASIQDQPDTDPALDLQTRRFLLMEVNDCFAGHLPQNQRVECLQPISAMICLTSEDFEQLVVTRKPHLHLEDANAQIGRTYFSISTSSHNSAELAPTMLSLQVIEKLAVCVKFNEPVLLVGETGTGKTAMVQYLSKTLGQSQLIVINLSQQSEAADLVGGFRPVSLSTSARTCVEDFQSLFCRTISRTKNLTYLEEVVKAFQKQNWDRLFRLMVQVIDFAKGKCLDEKGRNEWLVFEGKVNKLLAQYKAGSHRPLFAFVEGALTSALENGSWILLDEINLAAPETIEILAGILRSPHSSIMLGERGDQRPIQRHPNFRLFACMNPATDSGKRSLDAGIRTKFSEFFVDETDLFIDDLRMIVGHSLAGVRGMSPAIREAVIDIYYSWKKAAAGHYIVDGSQKRPLLNLRTLTRALHFARDTECLYGASRAVFEGLCMTFVTTLDEQSRDIANKLIVEKLGQPVTVPVKVNPAMVPHYSRGVASVIVENYIIAVGTEAPQSEGSLATKFLPTPSVKRNLANLARAVMARGHPILLEGPTSAGKTSIIEFLALLTGHRFIRINNHEHTDVQEYIGAYQPEEDGKLSFREGLLVEAIQKGYWLVLDELNLAPSDVLEALNRLLDDNRELYIPETNKVIKPHPSFLLFATQNPAGVYGGRKVLSRAFRSRFIELQFGDIPIEEVEMIISSRCSIAPSHAKKLSKVFGELQQRRMGSNLFVGRQSMVTLRDMFRWASRPMVTIEDLAENGFLVLAERLRHEEEKNFVRETIEGILKVRIDFERIYDISRLLKGDQSQAAKAMSQSTSVTWTKPMQRLFTLLFRAVENQEPVLLVGETGCGKTTACQILTEIMSSRMIGMNCHQNTETSDFLGSLRPTRNGEKSMYSWQDGPLVACMREGSIFLADEISLADDSVLERLNSVLEPSRMLTLAEAIGGEKIVASPGFAFLATMNPGGDYGKKELSPALRNRFTEIWVPSIGDTEDLVMILNSVLTDEELSRKMVAFFKWWEQRIHQCPALRRWPFSIRDILSWAHFVKKLASKSWSVVSAAAALFIDPAKSIAQIFDAQIALFCQDCYDRLFEDFGVSAGEIDNHASCYSPDESEFGTPPFMIQTKKPYSKPNFCFDSPTTKESLKRIMRALCLGRSILLEGSPGVGKTSIIAAIAMASGHNLVRINLSEQTDLIDLFGADMPVDGGFSWIDGPFLRALKRGDWVLLDELNLASQSVLEGLNACLDHRGQIYIPELDRSFTCPRGTRIFGAQNPVRQGGGRKGLPRSFVNRFISVWVDPLEKDDFMHILLDKAPHIGRTTIEKAVDFNMKIQEAVVEKREFASQGWPWEFNLRDLVRWAELSCSHPETPPAYFLSLIYASRMRTGTDRALLLRILADYFPDVRFDGPKEFTLAGGSLQIGRLSLNLCNALPISLDLLPSQLLAIETLLACCEHGWPSIIVGKAGKTSIIRLVASLQGRKLVELPLSSETDTMDLLGSFEQTSVEDELASMLAEAVSILGASIDPENFDKLMASSCDERLATMQKRYRRLKNSELSFEWHDGPLIKAMISGQWLVLDHANQCSASVLDRLNSVLEPGGYLILSEASSLEPRVILPHPNFRIFMTCSGPSELSRAMRNRGVEICLHEGGFLESLAIVRSAGNVQNSMAKLVVGESSDWHQLGKTGRLLGSILNDGISLPPTLNFITGCSVIRSASSKASFWLDAQIPTFGLNPNVYLESIIRELLGRGLFDSQAVALLESLWGNSNIFFKENLKAGCLKMDLSTSVNISTTPFAIVAVDKTSKLFSVAQSYGFIGDQLGIPEQQSISVGWKRIWKGNFSMCLWQRETLGNFFQLILNMPVAQEMPKHFTCLLDQLQTLMQKESLNLSGLSINFAHFKNVTPELSEDSLWRNEAQVLSCLSLRLAGDLGACIKKMLLLEAASLPENKTQTRMMLSSHSERGSLDFFCVANQTCSQLKLWKRSVCIFEAGFQSKICEIIVSNAVFLPGLISRFEKGWHDLVARELQFAEKLSEFSGSSPLYTNLKMCDRMVVAGLSQYRSLVSLYRQDPVCHYYLPKMQRLHTITEFNKNLLECQSTLRALLFGDESIPEPVEKVQNEMLHRLTKLRELFGKATVDGRSAYLGKATELLSSARIFAADGSVEKWLLSDRTGGANILKNLKIAKQRLMSDVGDISEPLLHAVDLIIIGIELHEISKNTVISGCIVVQDHQIMSERVISSTPGNATSAWEALRLHLLYRSLEMSLGHHGARPAALANVTSLLYEYEKRRRSQEEEEEKNSNSMYIFDGADEERKEEKLVEILFSNQPENAQNHIFDISDLFDKVYSGAHTFDLETTLAELVCHVNDASPRTLIELAYRQPMIAAASQKFNIYRDPHPQEALKALDVVRQLDKAVAAFLSEYPEHDVLQSLCQKSHRFATLSVSMPLICLLNSLEQLMQRTQIWQNYADSTHSLMDHIKNLINLVIRWRRMELEGWRQVLNSINLEYRKDSFQKLVWLCKVTSHEYYGQSGGELAKLLDTFLLAGPLGEFPHRLSLLKNCQRYPNCSSSAASIVRQAVSYFSITAQTVADFISGHTKQIGAELKASLISTVWNDKSYWSVEQTVQKTHRAIAKQVRKYRELLDQPFSIVMSKMEAPNTHKAKLLEAKKGLAGQFSWKPGKDLTNGTIQTKAFNRLGNVLRAIDDFIPPMALESVANLVFSRMEELAGLGGKDAIQIKQKSLVELLKLLKLMGIRLTAAYDSNEAAVSTLIAKASAYYGEDKSEEYLSRSLMFWHDLCNPSMQINEDLGVRQVEACRNAIFRLLECSLNQRALLGGSFAQILEFEQLCKIVDDHKDTDAVALPNANATSFDYEVTVCLLMAKQARELVKPHLNYEPNISVLESQIDRICDVLSNIHRHFPPQQGSKLYWISGEAWSVVQELLCELQGIILDNNPSAQDFIAPLHQKLAGIKCPLAVQIPSMERNYINDFMLLVQQIELRVQMALPSDFEKDEMGLHAGYLTDFAKTLSGCDFSLLIGSAISILKSALSDCHSRIEWERLASMAKISGAFFSHVKTRIEYQQRSLNKVILVTGGVFKALFSQGFCRPKESASEDKNRKTDESAKLEDGPGMAEGSGEKNVSGEIEFEEQITDLLRENNEKQEMEPESNDQAATSDEERLEMRTDFEAPIEDQDPDPEDGKDQKDNDEDEGKDKDEIMEDAKEQMGETGTGGELQELDEGWNEEEQEKDGHSAVEPSEYTPEGFENLKTEEGELKPDDLKAPDQEITDPKKDEKENLEMNAQSNDAADSKDVETQEESTTDDKDEGSTNEKIEEDNEAVSQDENQDQDEREAMQASDEDASFSEEEYSASDQEENSLKTPETAKQDEPTIPACKSSDDLQHEDYENNTAHDQNSTGSECHAGVEKQKQSAICSDEAGGLDKTVGSVQKTARMKNNGLEKSAASPIEEFIEKLQKSIHEILKCDESRESQANEEPSATTTASPQQLYEETNSGARFASGSSKEHADENIENSLKEQVDEEALAEELLGEQEKEEQQLESHADDGDSSPVVVFGESKTFHYQLPSENGMLVEKNEPTSEKAFSWDQLEAQTHDSAVDLCEQLRLILEPTKATKLRGDYRTGKRLNLRKIPVYIASQYRRDKIWLRRTKPSQRTYRIALSVDNSRSMRDGAGSLALNSLATIAQAMSKLEVGQLSVIAFGEEPCCLHPLDGVWTAEAGNAVLSHLRFDEEHTDIKKLLSFVNEHFPPDSSAADWQLNLILSDGIYQEHSTISQLINAGLSRRIINVFLVLDPTVGEISHVEYLEGGGIKMTKYLETFPFQFYVLLRELGSLPTVLADAIRQWFEALSIIE